MCLNALGFVEFTSEVHELFSPVVLVVRGLQPVTLHILSKGSSPSRCLQEKGLVKASEAEDIHLCDDSFLIHALFK